MRCIPNTHRFSESGFSLVGLAVVLVVLGLLVGGGLQGRELMANSRITNTIRQIQGFDAATTSFRDSYGALPGDLKHPQKKIPTCKDKFCGVGGNGNGVIGTVYRDVAMDAYVPQNSDEARVFWVQLANTKLITSVDPKSDLVAGLHWGINFPQAVTGGGFIVRALGAKPQKPYPALAGNYLALVQNYNPVDYVLTPAQAAMLDGKMDDGQAVSGDVIGWGNERCIKAGAYNQTDMHKSCNVYINIPE